MGFWYKKDPQATEVTDSAGGYQPSQPSQRFPFRPISPPRMDNANQPWYGSNDRSFLKGPDTLQDTDIVTEDPNSGQATFKLDDIWAMLNSFFGSRGVSDRKANLMDDSQVPSPENSMEPDNKYITSASPAPFSPFRWNDGGQAAIDAMSRIGDDEL